jgi:hypothetical protein
MKEDSEAWVIPYCISELEKFNRALVDFRPSNPELAELPVQDVVYRLTLEMHRQNQALMTALRHLHEKTKTS